MGARKLNFGRSDTPVLKLLRRVLQDSRGSSESRRDAPWRKRPAVTHDRLKTPTGLFERDLDFHIAARRGRLHRRDDPIDVTPQDGPLSISDRDNSDSAAG
jgi:hypothetical protein